MAKPTSTPLPNHAYRDGYQFPCVQPIDRFMKEFAEVKQ
ncbi:DUF4222 domain-containing protein [Raoultella planticola]|nr:DUF4222 domain-containing protein [Raoultella planticola]MCS7490300.1 DUF4222 domain-containing protein [Raoultella planticola]MDC3908053.1 DUF4222 domain-containing protein [Raoultella planticola]